MTIELAEDSAELRKARGAFFTPSAVTEYLAAWAIRAADDRVLEPSCGDGAILEAAAHRLNGLGRTGSLTAFELHEASAVSARQVLAEYGRGGDVRVGDFLATVAEPAFQAVIGNPPYIRYQGFAGEARSRGMAAALAQGVRLSRLSSSWAPFVVHACGYLAPGGRLALVLPAELLSSNYAGEVRDYLLRRFARISIVLFGAQVFPGVQTEAVLLLAEGEGGTDRVRFAAVNEAGDLGDARFDSELRVARGERWSSALVSGEAAGHLRALVGAETFTPLGMWGRISLGAVTGNNKYFTLTAARVAEWGLSSRDVVPISPAGSSHLRALTFTKAAHAAMTRAGSAASLFRPVSPTSAALRYIAHGEVSGVHEAYKCRARTPWWRTPLVAPPDLFFTYMNEATPQLATNPAGLHHLNSVHGLYLASEYRDVAELLALAALNSATSLSAEVTGRAYGGGILKLEPREAARLLVPSPDLVRSHRDALTALLPAAKRQLRAGRLPEVRAAVDAVLLVPGSGLTALRDASEVLSGRRRARGRRRPAEGGT